MTMCYAEKRELRYMYDNLMFDDLNDFDWRENKSCAYEEDSLYQCLHVLLNLACDLKHDSKEFSWFTSIYPLTNLNWLQFELFIAS